MATPPSTRGRTSAAAVAVSVVIHLVIVAALAAAFEATGGSVSEVHELTLVTVPPAPLPPAPEVEPTPAPPEPEPEPAPVRRHSSSPPPASVDPTETVRDPEPDIAEPDHGVDDPEPEVTEPTSGEPEEPTYGGPVLVASSRGVIGPGSGGSRRSHRTSVPRRPGFSPVRGSQVAAEPQLIGELAPRYPLEARRHFIDGAVRLLVEVRANGGVRGIRVIDDPGGGLAGAAMAELRRARFRPARDRRGAPVDRRIVYTVRFELDN